MLSIVLEEQIDSCMTLSADLSGHPARLPPLMVVRAEKSEAYSVVVNFPMLPQQCPKVG